MLLFDTKKTAQKGREILKTSDYTLFRTIEGNRNINLLHLNRLRQSMLEKYLFTIIIVNENMEIIDGQHRFTVCRELGLPVYYVICQDYGLAEVHRLNVNAKTWGPTDYLDGYIKLGFKEYEKYKAFKEKYKFTHKANCLLLTNQSKNESLQDFKVGKLKATNLKMATYCANCINELAQYYPGAKRYTFIYALFYALKKEQFDYDHFINKVKLQPNSLVHCTNVGQYVDMIEKIYNYRNRNKISLK